MADDISLDSDISDLDSESRPRRSASSRSATRSLRNPNEEVSLDSDISDRPLTRSSLREASVAGDLAKIALESNKILENFNPETSARERRKLNRKLNPGSNKKVSGAVFDENGAYISNGLNVCDCLFPDCPGCCFPCPKCESVKCGSECRVNRKYMYDSVEIEGRSKTYKNTYGK